MRKYFDDDLENNYFQYSLINNPAPYITSDNYVYNNVFHMIDDENQEHIIPLIGKVKHGELRDLITDNILYNKEYYDRCQQAHVYTTKKPLFFSNCQILNMKEVGNFIELITDPLITNYEDLIAITQESTFNELQEQKKLTKNSK